MDNLNKVLDYMSTDIKEVVQYLNNNEVSDVERQAILSDLSKQAQEIKEVIDKCKDNASEVNNSGCNVSDVSNQLQQLNYTMINLEDDLNINNKEVKFISLVVDTIQEILNDDIMYDTTSDMYFVFNNNLISKIQRCQ